MVCITGKRSMFSLRGSCVMFEVGHLYAFQKDRVGRTAQLSKPYSTACNQDIAAGRTALHSKRSFVHRKPLHSKVTPTAISSFSLFVISKSAVYVKWKMHKLRQQGFTRSQNLTRSKQPHN